MTSKERIDQFVRSAMPDGYFETAQKEFRDFYHEHHGDLVAAEKAFRNLVVLLLKKGEFSEPKVVSRVKERNECISKFDGKYRDDIEKTGETYKIKDYISDFIGIRVICIYESDINRVADILKHQFDVVDETNKSKEIEQTISSFGYKGLHLDLRLNADRRSLPEYSSFSDQQFEVQVRSIVQDAWSEVDHRLKYKKKTPPDLQRRIAGLAALFEIADREFEYVRDLSDQLEAHALNKQDDLDETQRLDLVGFIRVTSGLFGAFKFGGDALDTLMDDIAEGKSNLTTMEFRQIVEDNIDSIREYAAYLARHGHGMSPYTQLRHCLYKSAPSVFENIIFVGHRKNFDRWLDRGTFFPE